MVTPAKPIQVYLVEDHTLVRASLKAMLEAEPGVEVVGEAAEAERALHELAGLAVDVVLMDIGLPGANGVEATRELKRQEPSPSVVILTGHDEEYLASALMAGASGYVVKTCTRQHLLEAVRMAHEGHIVIDPGLASQLAARIRSPQQGQDQVLLTERQLQVLRLVADGMRHKDVASKLFMSEATVNREMRVIFDRLGVNDAAHAVSKAYKTHIF